MLSAGDSMQSPYLNLFLVHKVAWSRGTPRHPCVVYLITHFITPATRGGYHVILFTSP